MSIRHRAAFTLIELVIVVSIISMLAVIALPNFQEAQIRAQVAATKSNMRTVAIDIEMFAVDTNRLPLIGKWRKSMMYRTISSSGQETPGIDSFSTAYARLYGPDADIFEQASERHAFEGRSWLARNPAGHSLFRGFGYFNTRMMIEALENGCAWEKCHIGNWHMASELGGDWFLYSPGPDLLVESPFWVHAQIYDEVEIRPEGYVEYTLFRDYDPTNGTVSYGNILRTHKTSSGVPQMCPFGGHP